MKIYHPMLLAYLLITIFMVNGESTVSLWLAESDYSDYITPIDLDDVRNHYHLIVVGSGLSGASVAYHYHQKYPNRKILILERRDLPAAGASARNTGVLFATPDNAFQIDCVQMVLDLIEQENLDVDLVRKDLANLFTDNTTFNQNLAWYQSLSEAGKARTTVWDAEDVVEHLNMNPGLFVGSLTMESYQLDSYKLNLELIRLSGADIVLNAKVNELGSLKVTVGDDNQIIRGSKIVDCRGWEGNNPNVVPVLRQVISSTPMQPFLNYSIFSANGYGVQRPDGRVLFGGFLGQGDNLNDDSILIPAFSTALRQNFVNYFDISESFNVEYEWTGIIGMLPGGPDASSRTLFGFSGAGMGRIFKLAKEQVVENNYHGNSGH